MEEPSGAVGRGAERGRERGEGCISSADARFVSFGGRLAGRCPVSLVTEGKRKTEPPHASYTLSPLLCLFVFHIDRVSIHPFPPTLSLSLSFSIITLSPPPS